MRVVAQHEINDAVGFAKAIRETRGRLPKSMRLVHILISTDETQGVCLWRAESVAAAGRIPSPLVRPPPQADSARNKRLTITA